MYSLMVPRKSFFSDSIIHLPESFCWSLLYHALKLINDEAIIAMTLVIIDRPRKIHHLAGPTQTDIIRLTQVFNAKALLGGP